jgi:hypothetical protein
VLIGVDDVEPSLGEEAADRGDQSRPVGAGKQQARCRGIGDSRIIAAPSRTASNFRSAGPEI